MSHPDPLATLHPAVRAWFTRSFQKPSPPQAMGWPAVAEGSNVLILAPTGSGKTLAAFLQCLSYLYQCFEEGAALDDGVSILYVSPLKALNNDIHRNLEIPLAGIAGEAARMGYKFPTPRTALRTGDTPASERRQIAKRPPHILITTPESLFLMLSSGARQILRRVRYCIIDEIHALFPNKRGVHLAVSLEHLEDLAGRPYQRIGLSATQRPLDEVAAFLVGGVPSEHGDWHARPVRIIDTGQRKELDLRLILPVKDMSVLADGTIWPSIYRQILGLVKQHRSTLVFVNNRRLAERLTANLNDLAGERLAMTHHGSLAKEIRLEVERMLKEGKLSCLVATSSLELGIDVGSIDLVVQVESPKEVARGLQRVGRAGHLLGLPSKGRIIPKTRADLLECAAIAREMRVGLVEEAYTPENCLDVLSQQLVGLVSPVERSPARMFDLVRRAYPYRNLSYNQYERVLELLAGGQDDEKSLELQPRVFWDRVNDRVRASDRGRRLVYTSSGTIPDRGYFGVYLEGGGVRLGELDEEFVFERRLGERFVLGTSVWRIEEIRRDRIIVSPARRGEAMAPFWKGETIGRTFELGERIGRFLEEAAGRLHQPGFEDWVARECLMDEAAARNLHAYLASQERATDYLPSHKRLVVEEFLDELGAWRIVIHSPLGGRVHAALALLLRDRFQQRDGLEIETMHDDNGILLYCPGTRRTPRLDLGDLPLEDLEERMAESVRGSTLFALRFRQNAARALLLPRAPYGRKRTPLWLSRLRAADLLQTVSDRPDFPLVLETMRECLLEHFDLPGLRRILAGIRTGSIAVHHIRTARSSPFAQALQFNLLGTYMYVPDLPKGERRFRALGLDRDALRELLGSEEIRGLLDPAAISETAAEAAGTAESRRPRNADELHAWLRAGREFDAGLCPFTGTETRESMDGWLEELKTARRVILLSWQALGGRISAWVAAEDAFAYLACIPECRVAWPDGYSAAPVDHENPVKTIRRLLRRFARTHGPFTLRELEARYGLARRAIEEGLALLQADGLVQEGEFSPGVEEKEWCDVDLLQRIHRRSLARARREIEPLGREAYASFLARWQGVGSPQRGPEALAHVLELLRGLWLPAPAWGGGVLPLRVEDYREEMLERLVSAGRFAWAARWTGDRMRLAFLLPGGSNPPCPEERAVAMTPAASSMLQLLVSKGALFLSQIVQQTDLGPDTALAVLEELTALGMVTNDTLGPMRFFASRRPENRRYHLTQRLLEEMGRWSLLDSGPAPEGEQMASLLLERYGLITRDVASRDFLTWSSLLPVLERWEAVGKVRRGYFVEGLSGLQYALPEAVEGLRLPPGESLPDFWPLLRCDPANPYGSLLEMPGTDLQVEKLVLWKGRPALAAGGRKVRLAILTELRDGELAAALKELFARMPARGKLTVASFDGQPVLETKAADILEDLGFERGYKEMVRWEG